MPHSMNLPAKRKFPRQSPPKTLRALQPMPCLGQSLRTDLILSTNGQSAQHETTLASTSHCCISIKCHSDSSSIRSNSSLPTPPMQGLQVLCCSSLIPYSFHVIFNNVNSESFYLHAYNSVIIIIVFMVYINLYRQIQIHTFVIGRR